jgi:hypothetical protein
MQEMARSEKYVAADNQKMNAMLQSLVNLLENQAQRIAEQAAEIQQLRAEADILRWRCAADTTNAHPQTFAVNKGEAPDTAPLAVKESDRISSATEFLTELKCRYQKLALKEEALQKELNMIPAREEQHC